MLSKKLTRVMVYAALLVAFIGLFFTVRHNRLSGVPLLLDQNIFDTNENHEFIVDVRFQKCPRGSQCQVSDKDLDLSLNVKWIRVPKNLYLQDRLRWDLGFSRYYLFMKTINLPELTKDVYLTEHFYKKPRYINQIAIFEEKDSSPENKDKIPARVINDFNRLGESFTEMILGGLSSTKNALWGRAEREIDAKALGVKIPTLQEAEKLGWHHIAHGLWVKYGVFDPNHTLQRLDILYGTDAVDPRADWFLIKKPLLLGSHQQYPTYITLQNPQLVHRGSSLKPPSLKIRSDGTFKILQVADLHFLTGVGVCRDPFPPESAKGCEADPRTLNFLEEVLKIEKPDLVVLTGDQVFGETSPDLLLSALKAYAPFVSHGIPFAVTLGNHDDEGLLGRWEMMEVARRLPYSLSRVGPEKVAGIGNYFITVAGAKLNNPAMLLWFLDTHKYSPNPKTNPGYDWLKDSQLDWLEELYDHLKPKIEKYLHIHLLMAFFHIPIPEFRNFGENNVVGSAKEGVTASTYNTGVRTVFAKMGVSVASVGHDHCNDYCLKDNHKESKMDHDMWLCYGGAAGEGGYGGYGGTPRRMRVFNIDTGRNRVSSWKWVEGEIDKGKIDEQVLVDGGKAV